MSNYKSVLSLIRRLASHTSHGARSYRSTSAADARADQQQTRLPPLLSIDGTDRRRDGHPTVT